jgi:hypothetical protein
MPITTLTDTNAPANLQSRLLRWGLLAVCLLYMVQLWSPLRLSGDGVQLLSVAASAADGHGFLDHGQKTRYPPGYPAMVACLDRLGMARPWSLVGLNAVFMFLALGCAYYVACDYYQLNSNWALIVILFTSLSFALVKHFTQTLTDLPFFGTSMAALALTVRAEKESRASYYALWAAALSISIASVLIRPTALALFPCLAWSLGGRLGLGEILLRNKKILIGCTLFAVMLACALAIFLFHTIYIQGALLVFAHQGLGRGIRETMQFRVGEIGELTMNVPATKLGPLRPLVWIFGVAGIALLAFNARRCRMGVVEAYLAAYLFIVLIWPYSDARFWMPVLPLIFAELFSAARPWTFTGWKKRVTVAYSGAYAFMGLAALAYSTWITFSGREFPRRYGDGNLRATYEFFYSDPNVDRSKVDPPALEMLQRYAGPARSRQTIH